MFSNSIFHHLPIFGGAQCLFPGSIPRQGLPDSPLLELEPFKSPFSYFPLFILTIIRFFSIISQINSYLFRDSLFLITI